MGLTAYNKWYNQDMSQLKQDEHHCGRCGNATRSSDKEGFCSDCRLAADAEIASHLNLPVEVVELVLSTNN